MSPLEIAAFIVTAANVWLAVKQNIWTWPAGIVSVILYGVFYYQQHFYANAGLQLVYLALSIHGWYEWLHGGENKSQLHVRRTTRRQWIGCAIATVVLTVAIFELLKLTTDATFPFWDSLTTGISLVAQWMMNEKLLENWLGWLLVDVIYVPMFALGGAWLTAVLYAIFCWMAWRGFIEWRRSIVAPASS